MALSPMYRGDTAEFLVTVRDAAGALLDLTGRTLWFSLKADVRDPDSRAVAQKTTGAGIVHADQVASKGQATVTLLPADTYAVTPGTYTWDVQLIEGAKVTTVAEDTLAIVADVTRRIV